MRKNLLAFLFGLFAFNQLNAQITITQSGYPSSVTGTDSIKRTTYTSSFPSLAAAANGTWDMSTVTDSTPVFYNYRVPTATYQFADSNFYYFSTYAYQGNVQSSITSSALLEYGININYNGYQIGSTSADSVFIPAQNVVYTTPRTVIHFPATFNSSWTSAYTSDFDYQIVYPPLFTSHTPGQVKTYYTEQDTVVGWGKMRVKDATGSPSGYMNVLQVRTTIISTDSFFLSGSLAPALLLDELDVTQGQKDTSYQLNFYRTGEITPLAKVNYKDAAFTQPAGGAYHRQRLADPAGVATVAGDADISVYPNPVTGNDVFVKLPATAGPWSYELSGMDGRVIAADQLHVAGSQAQFTLPASAAPGIYYLRLSNNGVQVSVKAIDIAR